MKRQCGLSLMEVLVAVMIIAILAILTVPIIAKLRARAQRIECTTNLKNLHLAAQLYMQEFNRWPQVGLNARSDAVWEEFARQWIGYLAPYGPSAETWICPTLQNSAGNPDYTAVGNERVDYIGTPFDDKPTTPFDLGTPRTNAKEVPIPWFSEAEDVHGNGNLMIFADGSVKDLKTLGAQASPTPR